LLIGNDFFDLVEDRLARVCLEGLALFDD